MTSVMHGRPFEGQHHSSILKQFRLALEKGLAGNSLVQSNLAGIVVFKWFALSAFK